MIIWLASYPKNGNTWLRSLISAYYYTKDGIFLGDNHLKNVQQFPVKKYLESFDYDLSIPGDTSRLWVLAQEKINEDRKIKFFKTHNALVKLGNYDFTNRANSLGGIYIVRDPRNVVTSFSKFLNIPIEETANFMIKGSGDGLSWTSNWSNNFNSWKIFESYKRYLLLKYEDLVNEPEITFLNVLKFEDFQAM